jgi:predicted enzyme related to lactoylglutathione lyase
MTIPFRSITAMAHVQDMSASIAFYEKIGFRVAGNFVPPGQTEPSWAWLESGSASLMISQAGEPVIAAQQAVLFYLYTDDVAAKHAEFHAAGISVSEITYPFYNARGEFRISDPDGYVLMITHT